MNKDILIFLAICLTGCGLSSSLTTDPSLKDTLKQYSALHSTGTKKYLVTLKPLEYRLRSIDTNTGQTTKEKEVTELKIYDSEQAEAIFNPEIFNAQLLAGMSATNQLIPYDAALAGPTPIIKTDEEGPYVISVGLTELTIASDVDTTDTGHAGTVFRSVAQSAVGFIPGAAMFAGLIAPTLWNVPLDYEDSNVTSSVALDITLIDKSSGVVLFSFPSRASSTKKFREFGSIVSLHSVASAESPIEEATRLALFEGVKILLEKLKTR